MTYEPAFAVDRRSAVKNSEHSTVLAFTRFMPGGDGASQLIQLNASRAYHAAMPPLPNSHPLVLELLGESVSFVVLVLCGYAGIKAYVHFRQPTYSALLLKRRLAVIAFLMLLIVGVKVFEDVLANESGIVDRVILNFIHRHVPASLGAFFNAVTVAGSAVTVVPAALGAALALLFMRHRLEASLVIGSLGVASLLVYIIKTATGRARPDLWDAQWYWGSSFPSGHTLHTAAVATALALCAARLWPRSAKWTMAVAMVWTMLVAFSRLVLGAHWPTDVIAAICLGVLIPLSISMAIDLGRHRAAG